MQRLVGKTRSILWEGSHRDESGIKLSGYTPEYHRVTMRVTETLAERLPYTISPVVIQALDPIEDSLWADGILPAGDVPPA